MIHRYSAYYLLNKTRLVKVDGEFRPFHLLKLFPVHSKQEAPISPYGYDFPEYVAQDSFTDGARVFNNWPADDIGPKEGFEKDFKPLPQIKFMQTDGLSFVGYLKKVGRDLVLDRWSTIRKTYNSAEERQQAAQYIYEFIDRTFEFYIENANYTAGAMHMEYDLLIHYRAGNPELGVLLNMALS